MSPRQLRYESQVFAEPKELEGLLRRSPSVRRALFIDGVPKGFIGPRYRADANVTILNRPGGDAILRFGSSGLADAVGVNFATGNVVDVSNARGHPLLFVNTSIEKFILTVKAVIDRFPYYEEDATDDEVEGAAADVRDIIERIDPAAVVPDRYWSTFVDDMEMRDLSTGEVLTAEFG
jgi:hypothetical protein